MRSIFTVLTLILLVGCGGSSGSSTSTSQAIVVDMQLDKSYSVYEGDRLEKTSPNTEISIKKETQSDTTTVVLLKGSSTITRAN
ncbi:hypothetical protein [Sulfurimonas sp.]|jgi:uncharacterized protein YcfL|uniref:hypothetical protein n=1 Tax=Sulfurimonas sp. TaxID=2022749 RepID=UPI002600AF08|nr:hypothetical protein [Sulfurimonas sp.]MBT5935740.1 hypothetical protein [Sulfurimonas sp.]